MTKIFLNLNFEWIHLAIIDSWSIFLSSCIPFNNLIFEFNRYFRLIIWMLPLHLEKLFFWIKIFDLSKHILREVNHNMSWMFYFLIFHDKIQHYEHFFFIFGGFSSWFLNYWKFRVKFKYFRFNKKYRYIYISIISI